MNLYPADLSHETGTGLFCLFAFGNGDDTAVFYGMADFDRGGIFSCDGKSYEGGGGGNFLCDT